MTSRRRSRRFGGPRIVVAPAFNPAALSRTLVAWYDASNAASVTKDGSNLVGGLADLGPSGRNMVQATGANKPLWVASAYNSLPCLRATAGQSLSHAVVTGLADELTICYVGKPTGGVLFENLGVSASTGFSFGLATTSPTSNRQFAERGSTTHTDGAGGNAIEQWTLIKPPGLTAPVLRITGTVVSGAFATSLLLPAAGVNTVGFEIGHTSGASWDFCEVLWWNGQITAPEYAAAESYLRTKWGL